MDFKTKLDYTVRATRAPGETEDTYGWIVTL